MHQITTTIDHDELAAARAVVLAVDPDETDPAHGVAVVIERGGRRWTAWSGDAIASTDSFTHDAADEALVLVSRRLIEFAVTLAEHDGIVHLDLRTDGASVTDGTVVADFDDPSPRPVPALVDPLDDGSPRAEVGAGDLFRLLAMGRVLPAGVTLDEVGGPVFDVTIDDGRIVAEIRWGELGAPSTRLSLAADTHGTATAAFSPMIASRVVGWTDPGDPLAVSFPDHGAWIEIESPTWTARVRTNDVEDHDGGDAGEQLQFPFVGVIRCEGGLRPDPLDGVTLTDVRAFALDPDLPGRIQAAASRWNWDQRVQLTLATDDDERAVLALLDAVDPSREACQAIIDGPHTAARRILAGRNLLTPLLEQLAADDDTATRELASRTLAARAGRHSTLEVTR